MEGGGERERPRRGDEGERPLPEKAKREKRKRKVKRLSMERVELAWLGFVPKRLHKEAKQGMGLDWRRRRREGRSDPMVTR